VILKDDFDGLEAYESMVGYREPMKPTPALPGETLEQGSLSSSQAI